MKDEAVKSDAKIKRSVLEMYMAHPYPRWSVERRHSWLVNELCRYAFLGMDKSLKGARFLDVGCGTGNRSMLVSKHFGVREFVGFDHSTASLEVAKEIAQEESFERFSPQTGDLFDLPFEDGSFDVVVSWGVLHHTPDPFRGLKEMVRVCRSGGYVGVFLYNKWNHWRHNLQKNKVSRLAGEDFERRFRVAHDLYGKKPVEQMSPEEIATFYDQYCHPHKSDHTYGETLAWFKELGLAYWGSAAPLRFRDAIGHLQLRGKLSTEYPIENPKLRFLTRFTRLFPDYSNPSPPFKRPTILHRLFWQAHLVWKGRSGTYSQGSCLAARKP